MKITQLHPWNLSYQEAVRVQKELASKIVLKPYQGIPKLVAGADISFNKKSEMIYAGVVVIKVPEMEIVEKQSTIGKTSFPYIPGLLSFRELPLVCELFQKLKSEPDIVICDGQGIAHPRRIGLAAHLGLMLEVPTIGCAKSRLIGEHGELGEKRWSEIPLTDKGEKIGMVVRSRERVRPIFISPGHLIDFEGALSGVRSCITRYRIPEVTREAHKLVNQLREKC